MAGPASYGQQWTIEAGTRANVVFPAASVYISDLTVYAFHLFDGASIKPMQYDVSSDGGQTFPVQRATAFSPVGNDDVIGARLTAGPTGNVRPILLLNASQCIAYSDNLFTLPTTSTWTQVTPPGSVGAGVGFEVSGLEVVVILQDGGSNMKLAYSGDGGTSFTAVASPPAETVNAATWAQNLCSPVTGTWLLLSAKTGKVYRSTDSGATWSASVKTIAPGDAGVPTLGCIFAQSATRVVAVYKGQVSVSDDAGLTWTDKQNLTLNPPSTTAINQGAICYIGDFGQLNGVTILGGCSLYPHEFNGATTRGAMWRSLDLGTTWALIPCVGGSNLGGASHRATGLITRAGRGLFDLWSFGATTRSSWFDPNPAATPSIQPGCGATAIVDFCPEPEEA